MLIPLLLSVAFADMYDNQRGRAFYVSDEPCGTFLAGAEGNRNVPAHGCPVFSLGEPYYAETMLPKGYKTIVDWFQEVAADPNYANPNLVRFDDDDTDEEEQAGGIEMDLGEDRIQEIEE